MSDPATPVLDVVNVFKRYGDLVAVDGVSFRVGAGECYGLLGPNGAGKTTLFKLITGMAARSEGGMTVFGLDPAERVSEVKARLGVVGQEDSLDPDLGVWDNLLLYGSYFGLKGPAFERRCEELLEFLELGQKRGVPIMALSGGMKRRLAIVRALLNEPEMLLLDEPTTGLDPQIRHAIWNAIRKLKKQGLTILLTTHYMEEAAQLADRIGIVDHGKTIAEGAPGDVIKEHLPAYVLEFPASRQEGEGWRGLGESALLEEHGDRVYVFHDALPTLEGWCEEHAVQAGACRRTSLEDLFLRLTGRSLRE
jgi:lipooligosaccharide transport system ATP-binding protein